MDDNEEQLNATFAALADPIRRAILRRLAGGEASVTELAEPFDVSLPAVSRHLKVLEAARLIERRREGTWRPCRLRPEGLGPATDWIQRLRRFWEDQFDALDRYLATLSDHADTETDDE